MATKPEQRLQEACADYLQRFCPEPPDGPLWCAINPKPTRIPISVAAAAKRMGAIAGMPDLCFAWRDGKMFWVELKAGASLSAEQRYVHYKLQQLGHQVYVATSLGELAEALGHEGVPVKAEVSA